MVNRLADLPVGLQRAAGAFAAAVGLAVVYFGLGIGTEGAKKEASARIDPAPSAQQRKPVHTMNLALGDMVFLAQDLGFSAAGPKGAIDEPNKIAARIEGQLQGIRELYRQEAAKNASLVGAMIVQLDVALSGEVTRVKEVSSRLGDEEFKKSVLGEASKWSFSEIVGEALTVTCPLLFVREGMDITTLVRWEKSLSGLADKGAAPNPKSAGAGAASVKAPDKGPGDKTALAAAKMEGREFRIKYATVLRAQPSFTAAPITTFTIGTRVAVLARQGDWLEVRSRPEGPTGFIRKEFVAPLDVARDESGLPSKAASQRSDAAGGPQADARTRPRHEH